MVRKERSDTMTSINPLGHKCYLCNELIERRSFYGEKGYYHSVSRTVGGRSLTSFMHKKCYDSYVDNKKGDLI